MILGQGRALLAGMGGYNFLSRTLLQRGNSHGAHSSARTWNNSRIEFREVDSLIQISSIELG